MNTRLTLADLHGKRWRGYIRESTERQADSWSPERQRADIARAADELGMVPAEPLFYQRTGSGETEGAPELTTALTDGRSGQFDVLVVLHTSRLARNRLEALQVKRAFAKAGLAIYFVAQRVISGTREGLLTEGLNELLDEHANEERRLWIAGGLRERQLAGKWVGSVPFGYRRALVDRPDGTRGWDGTLEPDDNAVTVRRIFAEILAGTPTRDVAVALGPPWQRRTVLGIVQNPVYIGWLARYRRASARHYYSETDAHDGRRDMSDVVPQLIDLVSFEQANRLVAERTYSPGVRGAHLAFPLTGVLRCGACGRKMTGAHGRGEQFRYYRCVGRTEVGDCAAPYAKAAEVEGQFARWIGSFSLPADWRQEIAKLSLSDARANDDGRRRKLAGQLTRIKNLYLLGDLTLEEYQEQSGAIKDGLAATVPPSITNIGKVVDALADLGAAWSRDSRATIPALLLNAAVVRDRRIVEWEVRADLRPLLEMCVPPVLASDARPYSRDPGYIVRYSA